MNDKKNSGGPIDRRTLLQLMAATGSVAAFGGVGGSLAAHAASSGGSGISVVSPKYETFYKHYSDYFMNDPQWVTYTSARLKWPAKGERVPDLSVVIPNSNPDWLDAFRKWSRMQPGWTRAVRRSGSISMIAFMKREKSKTTATFTDWPAMAVPPPLASTGTSWRRQISIASTTSEMLRGTTMPIGT